MGADEQNNTVQRGFRAHVFLIQLGLFAFLAAIAGGGYIAYSAKSDAPSTVEELRVEQAEVVLISATPRAIVTPAPTPAPTPTPPFANQAFRMAIDKIGVDAPVVAEGMDEQQVPEVPYNGYEVAWYDFSAQPGTPGNAVFAGHKTWAGEAVFHDLDQLEPGDTVRLRGEEDGAELVYRVTESFTVREDDPNGVQVMLHSPLDIVTIITCDGTRYYTGDELGHDYTERRVIRAIRDTSAPPLA